MPASRHAKPLDREAETIGAGVADRTSICELALSETGAGAELAPSETGAGLDTALCVVRYRSSASPVRAPATGATTPTATTTSASAFKKLPVFAAYVMSASLGWRRLVRRFP